MRNILVDHSKHIPIEEQRFEIVERKGLGHPDSICDAIMDNVSVKLSKEYLEKVGTILHHNADKSLLVAGDVELNFGGGMRRNLCFLYLVIGPLAKQMTFQYLWRNWLFKQPKNG